MKRIGYMVLCATVGLLLTACNVTRKLQPGEYYLQRVEIHPDKEVPRSERIRVDEFKKYLRQRPNKRLFGLNIYTGIYNLANPEKDNGWNNLKRKLGEAPVIMEQALVERSADNFKNYMDSRGFFTSEVKYQIDTTRREKRAYISFDIHQGEPYRISGLRYLFRDKALEPIVLADTANSLIHPGEIFNIATLSAERERITQLLKNKGYYNFSVAGIEYEADTLKGDHSVGLTLIVKQNLQGYNERGEPIMGNNVRYRIDEVNIFPQYDPLTAQNDSLFLSRLDTISYRGLNIIYEGRPELRKKVVRELVPIYRGFLYSADRISRTYDNLMSIGYFKSAKIAFVERAQEEALIDTIHFQSPTVDSTAVARSEEGFLQCNILCTPALKQSFKIELEGSMTSSFYGLSATVGYQNRNIFRGAEALDLAFTTGYEYMRAPNAKKRNAIEFGVSAGLSFPRFLLPFHSKKFQTLVQPRTKVSVSVNFQDRPYYRRVLSNASWGYSWGYRYSSFVLRPADITVVDVSYLDNDFYESLQNSYLQNSYRSQLIPALSFSYVYNNQRKHLGGNATVFRLNAEVAGNLLDLMEHLCSTPVAGKDYYELFGIRYSQYFRVDASISRKIMLGEKCAIVGRLYAGTGLAYGNAEALPMDRLFYAGGSNSMRGWTPRTLGPGTTPLPKDMLYPTQLGDMRLEANLEFRFPIWGIFHGATFLDAGNIWFMRRNDAEYSPDAVFYFKDFYKGLGFNTGLGIRLDIKFAVLRLDWGVQLHSPNEPAGKRWIHNFKWDKMALNFGVGYPF